LEGILWLANEVLDEGVVYCYCWGSLLLSR